MIQCRMCKKLFKAISNTHLSCHHGITIKQYARRFGNRGTGFILTVGKLPKNDPRYIGWRESLKKRPPPWSKGHTKETHPSVAKISDTFRKKKIDNFAQWRKKAREEGLIPLSYPPLQKTEQLAFLHGLILGDGHIRAHPRTECLTITLGTDKPKLWKKAKKLVEEVFQKEPSVYKPKDVNCVAIRLYQKSISKRLGIPTGSRKNIVNRIPNWIRSNRKLLIIWLRGLYEAEGCFCIHKPTYTYKLIFTNKNESLLSAVYQSLCSLGFHPHRSKYKVQVSRKKEVYAVKDLIKFRNYDLL